MRRPDLGDRAVILAVAWAIAVAAFLPAVAADPAPSALGGGSAVCTAPASALR